PAVGVEVVGVVGDPRLGRRVGALLVDVAPQEGLVVIRGRDRDAHQDRREPDRPDHGEHRVAVLLAEEPEIGSEAPDQTRGRLSWFGYWRALSSRTSTALLTSSGEFGSCRLTPLFLVELDAEVNEIVTYDARAALVELRGVGSGDALSAPLTKS